MSVPLVALYDVSKKFQEIEALKGVSLQIHPAEVIGLVGGNGAGKTTLLRLLSGLYRPTHGEVLWFGDDGQAKPLTEVRTNLGTLPESTGLYSRLTAWENIRYHARIHGMKDEFAYSRTLKLAEKLEMSDSLHRPTRGFSRGMRQKTALIRSLVHGPKLLLLDEPTAGLDVTSARMVKGVVSRMRDEGATIVYSTHHLAEAESICDRIIIIHNGEVRADGHPSELRVDTHSDSLEEAYISLTSDKAREVVDLGEKEGRVSRLWTRITTFASSEKRIHGKGGDECE